LSHNETSTAKTDHKNEISTKNWVGSTWVAKSQLWSKVTWVKVNTGQRNSKKSTVNMVNVNGQGNGQR
jgi:hypothetical protein